MANLLKKLYVETDARKEILFGVHIFLLLFLFRKIFFAEVAKQLARETEKLPVSMNLGTSYRQ